MGTMEAVDGEKVHLAMGQDVFPHIDSTAEKIAPLFDADMSELRKKVEDDAEWSLQLVNKVKIGPCGKPNAFTMKNCNACGGDLTATEITHSNNIFTGFI